MSGVSRGLQAANGTPQDRVRVLGRNSRSFRHWTRRFMYEDRDMIQRSHQQKLHGLVEISIAVLLALLVSCFVRPAQATAIVSCAKQSKCLDFSISCAADGTGAYKVCMTVNLTGRCSKRKSTHRVSHICSSGNGQLFSEGNLCFNPPHGYAPGGRGCPPAYRPSCKIREPSSGVTICQVVPPHGTAKFVAKDGMGRNCGQRANTTVTGFQGGSLFATCRSKSSPLERPCRCQDGRQDNECIWEVPTPAKFCRGNPAEDSSSPPPPSARSPPSSSLPPSVYSPPPPPPPETPPPTSPPAPPPPPDQDSAQPPQPHILSPPPPSRSVSGSKPPPSSLVLPSPSPPPPAAAANSPSPPLLSGPSLPPPPPDFPHKFPSPTTPPTSPFSLIPAGCQTAYAASSRKEDCYINTDPLSIDYWGWTFQPYALPAIYPLYAAAEGCDVSKGQKVGDIIITNTTVMYVLLEGFRMSSANLYVGREQYPLGPGRRSGIPWPFQKVFACPAESANFPGLNITMDMFIIAQADICGHFTLPADSKLAGKGDSSRSSRSWDVESLSSSSSSQAADYVSSQIWKDLGSQVIKALEAQSREATATGADSGGGQPAKAEAIQRWQASGPGAAGGRVGTLAAAGGEAPEAAGSEAPAAAGGGAPAAAGGGTPAAAAAAGEAPAAADGTPAAAGGGTPGAAAAAGGEAPAAAGGGTPAAAAGGGIRAAAGSGTPAAAAGGEVPAAAGGGIPAAAGSGTPAAAAAGGEVPAAAGGGIPAAAGSGTPAAAGGGAAPAAEQIPAATGGVNPGPASRSGLVPADHSEFALGSSSGGRSNLVQLAPSAGANRQSSTQASSLPGATGPSGSGVKGGLGEAYTLNAPGQAVALAPSGSGVPMVPLSEAAAAAAGGPGQGNGSQVKQEAMMPEEISSVITSTTSEKYEVSRHYVETTGGFVNKTEAVAGVVAGGFGRPAGTGTRGLPARLQGGQAEPPLQPGAAAGAAGPSMEQGGAAAGAAGPPMEQGGAAAGAAGPSMQPGAAAAEGGSGGGLPSYHATSQAGSPTQPGAAAGGQGEGAAETAAGGGGLVSGGGLASYYDTGQAGLPRQPGAAAGGQEEGAAEMAAGGGGGVSGGGLASYYDTGQARLPTQPGPAAGSVGSGVDLSTGPNPLGGQSPGAGQLATGLNRIGLQPAPAHGSDASTGARANSGTEPPTPAGSDEEAYGSGDYGPQLEGDDTILSDEYLGTLDDFMRHFADADGGHYIGEGKRKLARAADALEPT